MDITNLSKEQKQELFVQLQKEQQSDVNERREAYEKLRKDVVERIKERVVTTGATVKELFDFVKDETSAFYAIMSEYGALSRDGQMNYTLMEDDFKVEVR
ncbi:MAG: hypothetical protein SNH66_07125, partial [Rikenellaceae bacterium]